MKIYAIRNRLISAYLPPVFAVEEKEGFIEAQRRFIILQTEDAKKAHLDECELYYVGEYDDKICDFKLFDKPEFLVDLGGFFPERGNN